MKLSVFGRDTSQRFSNRNNSGEVNVSINCGWAIVNAGDLVVADRDGVVEFPINKIKQILVQTKNLFNMNKLKKYLNEGGNQDDYFKLNKL